jgi:hypothetical protein
MGVKNCNGPARKLFFSDGQKTTLVLPVVDLDETVERIDKARATDKMYI